MDTVLDSSERREPSEIEVTPAMAKVGARILEDWFDADSYTAPDRAADLFRAMAAAMAVD